MIFLDKPFVSDFLKNTIRENALPVVQTTAAEEFGFTDEPFLLREAQAIEKATTVEHPTIYTTSENAIGWIAKHLPFTNLPAKIDLFKNKAKFRSLIQPMYPNFYFREISLEELTSVSMEDIPLPVIIKPGVGFFSMGVHKVSSAEQWPRIINEISAEIRREKDLYPVEVLNTATFIIEQCIEGKEFAVDAYFNDTGEPVILGIFKHIFSTDQDVSDRVYITSKEIIEDNIDPFSAFLGEIGNRSGVKNFPVHAELRRIQKGSVLPIEINPMRFGGWCTTADITGRAYGFNPYVYYFTKKKPDWNVLLKNKAGKLYGIVVLDNSTGVDGSRIAAFDYDRLLLDFENPLELRKIDFTQYPVFGFLFTETSADNFAELEKILQSDLKEFITEKGTGE